MKTPRRTAFGAKAEELLGDRAGDRALRLSDLDAILAEHTLKVVSNAGFTPGEGAIIGSGSFTLNDGTASTPGAFVFDDGGA